MASRFLNGCLLISIAPPAGSVSWSNVRVPSDSWKTRQREVAGAFGMAGSRGNSTIFSRFAESWVDFWSGEWFALGGEVAAYMQKGDKETIAIENVALDWAHNRDQAMIVAPHMDHPPAPSKSKVRQAWKRYQKEFPEAGATRQ